MAAALLIRDIGLNGRAIAGFFFFFFNVVGGVFTACGALFFPLPLLLADVFGNEDRLGKPPMFSPPAGAVARPLLAVKFNPLSPGATGPTK